jgi:predicted DNA-binding protein (MmcQ/YjbR family)
MNLESLRQYCLSLPHVTEKVQWQDDLLFCIGGKMFAIAPLEKGWGQVVAFKCSEQRFADLLEREGVKPAPYLARAKWVALERFDALTPAELRESIREAYDLIFVKLSKKQRDSFAKAPKTQVRSAGKRKR